MKLLTCLRSLPVAAVLLLTVSAHAQNPVNWTSEQLMEPAALAQTLRADSALPLIISVGPGATIPHSVAIGMVNNKEGLQKLQQQLDKTPKNKKIVVYCGCCPFEHCPNVRPAIALLKQEKFTSFYLLNIPSNLKKDWIDKGYPVEIKN
jgi:hypothetical protein